MINYSDIHTLNDEIQDLKLQLMKKEQQRKEFIDNSEIPSLKDEYLFKHYIMEYDESEYLVYITEIVDRRYCSGYSLMKEPNGDINLMEDKWIQFRNLKTKLTRDQAFEHVHTLTCELKNTMGL